MMIINILGRHTRTQPHTGENVTKNSLFRDAMFTKEMYLRSVNCVYKSA